MCISNYIILHFILLREYGRHIPINCLKLLKHITYRSSIIGNNKSFFSKLYMLFENNSAKSKLKFIVRLVTNSECPVLFDTVHILLGIRRYQRGRQKSLRRKTDKTIANKMKRKTNIEHTTLH